MLDLVDILCVNCQEFISSTSIDVHSRTCTRVTRQVILAESSAPLIEIDFKLDKLKHNIEGFLKRRHFDLISSSVFEKLLEITDQLQQYDTSQVEEARRVSVFLQSHIREFDGEIYCLLYLERLFLMATNKLRELLAELTRQDERKQIHDKLTLKKKQLDAYKLEIEFFKDKALRMEEFLGRNPLDLQESFVHSYAESIQESDSKSFVSLGAQSSVVSSIESSPIKVTNFFTRETDEDEAPSSEDLKREFYTKCLLIKFTLESTDPAQYVKVNKLYELALRENIPVSDWDNFIKQQFAKPERYLARESGVKRRRLGVR
mmetsp:Transcript_3253/g.6706  ORF Transcript_3253/g.6706 Transcript_3253/m.6706 type:complete len:318 (-) Transcript_3253:1354-2307(-)